jgi:hypothetical protein
MKADELFDDNLNVDTDPVGDIDEHAADNDTSTAEQEPAEATTDAEPSSTEDASAEAETKSQQKSWLVNADEEDGQDSKTDASDDTTETGKQFVPDSRYALQRERQRRRELEEELERLREKADNPDSDDDPDDEEFLTAAQARRLAARAIQEALKQKDQEISRIREAEQVKSRLLACEQAFRSRVPDYDTVVEAALKEDVLTKADRSEAYQAKDPAKALYLAAKQKLSLLGIELPVPKKTTQIETTLSSEQKSQEPDETMSPEALFDSIFK